MNKDVSLSFDGGVERSVPFERSHQYSAAVVVDIEPPAVSRTLKVTVKSVFGQSGNNGFVQIVAYDLNGTEVRVTPFRSTVPYCRGDFVVHRQRRVDLWGAPCRASSNGHKCKWAFDPNRWTSWMSGIDRVGSWISVTFPRRVVVNQIHILNRHSSTWRCKELCKGRFITDL